MGKTAQINTKYMLSTNEAIFSVKEKSGKTDHKKLTESSDTLTIGFIGDIHRLNDNYITFIKELLDEFSDLKFIIFSNSGEAQCRRQLSLLPEDRYSYTHSLNCDKFSSVTDICYVPELGIWDVLFEQLMLDKSSYIYFNFSYAPFDKETMYEVNRRGWADNFTNNPAFSKALKYSLEKYVSDRDRLNSLFTELEKTTMSPDEKSRKVLNVCWDTIYMKKFSELGITEPEYSNLKSFFFNKSAKQYSDTHLKMILQNTELFKFMAEIQADVYSFNKSIGSKTIEFLDLFKGDHR